MVYIYVCGLYEDITTININLILIEHLIFLTVAYARKGFLKINKIIFKIDYC